MHYSGALRRCVRRRAQDDHDAGHIVGFVASGFIAVGADSSIRPELAKSIMAITAIVRFLSKGTLTALAPFNGTASIGYFYVVYQVVPRWGLAPAAPRCKVRSLSERRLWETSQQVHQGYRRSESPDSREQA